MFNRYGDTFNIVREKYMLLSLNELKGLCNSYKIQLPYQAQKDYIIFEVLANYISRKNALESFFNTLAPLHQKILKHIVLFDGSGLKKEIQKKFLFNIELPSKSKIQKYVWWLELFIDHDAMDEDIRGIFLSFLGGGGTYQVNQKIKIKDIEEINGIEIKKVTINNKPITQKLTIQKTKDMTESIHIFYNLLKAKKITITQQNALTVKTYKTLVENLHFSDEEIFSFLNLFSDLKYSDGKKEKSPTKAFDALIVHSDTDIIKHLLENFMKLDFQYEAIVCPFQFSTIRGNYITIFRKDIVKIISTLGGNNWINCEYIVEQIPINEATLKLITNDYSYSYRATAYKSNPSPIKHLRTVIRYFIKGFISILYRFGLCDIAQTRETSYFAEDLAMIDSNYIGRKFSDIEYFQLTDLGRYVFGFTQDYTSKGSYKLLLNRYSLDIMVENESNLSEIFLANIATKISQNKYKTDIKTFMQTINSHKELLNIKEAFTSKAISIPQNWLDFFSLLERRIVALKSVTSSATLIKIPNDKEIIQLIATNQKLKQKIIKADNLHIVVLKEDIQAVRIILKEQGILI